jgi:chromosome segregation ATPase
MNDLSEKVDTIEIKVRQLALRIDRVQKERDKYLEENNKLRTELTNYNNKTKDLENKLVRTTLALEEKKENDPEHSKKLRKELEQYIKDIDKCIDRLKNS